MVVVVGGVGRQVVGSGHSFSSIALTDGVMISLEAYDQVVHIDQHNKTVTVQVIPSTLFLFKLLLHGQGNKNRNSL